MAMVVRSIRIEADADAVWDVVGDFGRLDAWLPTASRPVLRDVSAEPGLDGRSTPDPFGPSIERVFDAGTEQELVEQLTDRDDRARRLIYATPAAPLPGEDHRASIMVRPLGRGCEVVWTAAFRADPGAAADLDVAIGEGVFEVGLDALAARFGGR